MQLRDPSSKEERLEKMHRRLGGRDEACDICGEDHPACLERHHVAGVAFSDETICLCRNCHRKVTFDQNDHPKGIQGLTKEDVAEIRRLLGWADINKRKAEFYENQALKIFDKADISDGGKNGGTVSK